eukprot:1755796-Prymnesium_polylepis.1
MVDLETKCLAPLHSTKVRKKATLRLRAVRARNLAVERPRRRELFPVQASERIPQHAVGFMDNLMADPFVHLKVGSDGGSNGVSDKCEPKAVRSRTCGHARLAPTCGPPM